MRGEPEVEDSHIDSRTDLGSVKITKRGEKLPDGSQLVRMLELERKVEDWSIELFVENPGQPRTDFDPEQLEGLQESITAHGQLVPARAVPILLRDGSRRFLLIDGACRKRAREALSGIKCLERK